MAAQILPFPGTQSSLASPIAFFVRIGDANRKYAELLATGHLPARRVVFRASRVKSQRELLSVFRDIGAELVLDSEAAELAAPSKFSGGASKAPWASGAGPLGPDYYRNGAASDVIGHIARFAVENKFTTVLAPAHLLDDPNCNEWLEVDVAACTQLRAALDREGGRDIAIDFPLIVSSTKLNDSAQRMQLMASLHDLPVDNIWLRLSGLGPDAGPLVLKRYLSSVSNLHNLGKPIVADFLGGLVGLASIAFGVTSGIATGIGQYERFDAKDWHKPPPPKIDGNSFGRPLRIRIPGLQNSLSLKELELLAAAKGGRRLCGCSDRSCCANGFDDMISDPRRHQAIQAFKSISSLEAVPDLRREWYFLNGPIAATERTARGLRGLQPPQDMADSLGIDLSHFNTRVDQSSRRTERLFRTLEHIQNERGDEAPRARVIRARRKDIAQTGRDKS